MSSTAGAAAVQTAGASGAAQHAQPSRELRVAQRSVCTLRLPPQVEPGSKIKFGRVVAMKQGGKFTVGKPYLDNVSVEAEVLEELKAPKVRNRAVFWSEPNPPPCTQGVTPAWRDTFSPRRQHPSGMPNVWCGDALTPCVR